MDFKTYAAQKRKEAHKEIIADICMIISNCANCHNDVTMQTECYPLNCVDLYKVTADSFYMDPYDNSKTNKALIDIAAQHGYEAGLIRENEEITAIKFWKK